MTSVFIIAASPIVRAGLESLVATDRRFTVVGSAPSVGAAVSIEAADVMPEVLLVDLDERNGATRDALLSFPNEVTEEASSVGWAVVLLVDDLQSERLTKALRDGVVRAVLPRTATVAEIIAAIGAAAAGLFVLHPEAFDPLIGDAVDEMEAMTSAPHVEMANSTKATVETLTKREIEVLTMLAEGHGNKVIAWRLGISEHTVKFHVSSVFAKLGAASRTEAVTLGIRQGLIML